MFILWCHFSKLCILMERCKYQSIGLLNPIHSPRWVGGLGGGNVGHWFAVLKVLWSRDRCSWKVTECIALPICLSSSLFICRSHEFVPKWEMQRSRSCCWAQGKLFNEQGVLFSFFSSSLPMYGILKMEMSFWEQYLNSQESTYSVENEFNQVYIKCCF